MAWAVWPSTPAERAPRLLRTRRHAVSRKAGSATRLKRSANRRSGSSLAHWCSLVCMRSTRASATSAVGHGAPVFTDDLLPCTHQSCEVAARLRPVAGSPGLRLLRGLRPIPRPSADDAPARRRSRRPSGRATSRWFPRSPHDRSTGVVPSFSPAASSTNTPQAFSVAPRAAIRGPPSASAFRLSRSPTTLLPGPNPPGLEPVSPA